MARKLVHRRRMGYKALCIESHPDYPEIIKGERYLIDCDSIMRTHKRHILIGNVYTMKGDFIYSIEMKYFDLKRDDKYVVGFTAKDYIHI